ncbi:MAG: hypothetical protein Q4G49_08615, partial [Paracoccus sp. (in: a-proteobacteria)]|nr:hypothetical protein [Paracoccus sp. (in: a-proteobacteria)]
MFNKRTFYIFLAIRRRPSDPEYGRLLADYLPRYAPGSRSDLRERHGEMDRRYQGGVAAADLGHALGHGGAFDVSGGSLVIVKLTDLATPTSFGQHFTDHVAGRN